MTQALSALQLRRTIDRYTELHELTTQDPNTLTASMCCCIGSLVGAIFCSYKFLVPMGASCSHFTWRVVEGLPTHQKMNTLKEHILNALNQSSDAAVLAEQDDPNSEPLQNRVVKEISLSANEKVTRVSVIVGHVALTETQAIAFPLLRTWENEDQDKTTSGRVDGQLFIAMPTKGPLISIKERYLNLFKEALTTANDLHIKTISIKVYTPFGPVAEPIMPVDALCQVLMKDFPGTFDVVNLVYNQNTPALDLAAACAKKLVD